VLFTNGVGLTKAAVATVRVVDPPGRKAPTKASITGTVVEGDRLQVGIPVQLNDTAGRAIRTTKTAAGGKFVFEDLDPGSYRVVATKSASRTRGETPVGIGPGEQKTGVEVKLYR